MTKPIEETVTITKAEYDELVQTSLFMGCLQTAGVDNWEGYSYACDIMEDHA